MTMMECPRCGFQQPNDQFCAKCGLNIETFVVKPKPIWVRTLQNPNFHLSLIGILILGVVGWIFYSQAGLMKREVGQLVGMPISSRDAADPNEVAANARAAEEAQAPETDFASEASSEPQITAASGAAAPGSLIDATALGATDKSTTGGAPAAATKIEVSYWEIPRELLQPVLAQAQQVGQGRGGRAFFWPQNTRLKEVLQSGAQSLAATRTMNVQAGAQITVETPPNSPEMFQFGMMLQLVKADPKDISVRWDASLVLPQPESPGQTQPAVRQIAESSLTGSSPLNAQNVIAIIFEPSNRAPREEYLAKAGFGPWSIFSSPEYRAGLTDWAIIVELK